MRWLALAAVSCVMVVAAPQLAVAQTRPKLVGCGSSRIPPLQPAKGARSGLEQQPTRTNWLAVMYGWGDGNPLTMHQCLQVRRLQRAANAYKMDTVSVQVPNTREFETRPPDWFDHAERATSSGLPGEAIAVIDEQRISGKVSAGDGANIYGVAKQRAAMDRQYGPPQPPTAPVVAQWKWQRLRAEGMSWLSNGGFAQAAIFLDKASAVAGFNPMVELDRGYAHYRAEQIPQAIAAYKKVKDRAKGLDSDLAAFWLIFLKVGSR